MSLNATERAVVAELDKAIAKIARLEVMAEAVREIARRPYANPVAVRIQQDIRTALASLVPGPA